MDGLYNTNWFAVHTKRFGETLASSCISALGFECFLPMVKVEWLDQTVIKRSAKPLFAGYCFAKFCPATSLCAVETSRGVLRVVKAGAYPLPIDEPVLLEMKQRVEPDGLIRLRPQRLYPGDRVAVEQGPFAGMMGRVESELDDQRRVAILLEALWNARVLIEKRWVVAA